MTIDWAVVRKWAVYAVAIVQLAFMGGVTLLWLLGGWVCGTCSW